MPAPEDVLTGEDVRKLIGSAPEAAVTGRHLKKKPNAPAEVKKQVTDVKALKKYADQFPADIRLVRTATKPSAARYVRVEFKKGKVSILHTGRYLSVARDGVLYAVTLDDEKLFDFAAELATKTDQPSK